MWLMINPTDVWMFRDGKPFTSGDNHIATSLFPPSAITVQGMLRSLYLNSTKVTWDDYNGHSQEVTFQRSPNSVAAINAVGSSDDNSLGSFQMRGPYLARWDTDGAQVERFFPLPADIVANKRNRYMRKLQPVDEVIESDLPYSQKRLNLLLEDKSPSETLWLSETFLIEEYLNGISFSVDAEDTEDFGCVPQERLFMIEQRTGTAINYARNTVRHEDGMLYSAGFFRLEEHVGLLVELPDPSPLETVFPSIGATYYARFGGEGRSARVTRIQPEIIKRPTSPPRLSGGKQKIIFTTPSYFALGWRPSDKNLSEKLISAALPRPLAIGGWDLGKRSPRPIIRYIAPGSVFYFDGTNFEAAGQLTEQPSDSLPLEQLGFGEYITGNWEYEES
jgi:CRISPR-associated protein Cmr3